MIYSISDMIYDIYIYIYIISNIAFSKLTYTTEIHFFLVETISTWIDLPVMLVC